MNSFPEEQRALDNERKAFEHRQKAFFALLKQATPQGNGALNNLDDWEKAEADWQAATAVVQRIADEIRAGVRP
jgi:hypothetical protein